MTHSKETKLYKRGGLAVVALGLLPLAACVQQPSEVEATGVVSSGCVPLSFQMTAEVRETVLQSGMLPAEAKTLPYQGSILRLEVASATALDPAEEAKLQRLGEIFLTAFNEPGEPSAIVTALDVTLEGGRTRLTEYDETCVGKLPELTWLPAPQTV
jgi:hypothetical protein